MEGKRANQKSKDGNPIKRGGGVKRLLRNEEKERERKRQRDRENERERHGERSKL